jgi:riboflavin transporter FmnP
MSSNPNEPADKRKNIQAAYSVATRPRTIALIVIFGALAIALNPIISGIGFPYPLVPGLWFEIWEIPIICAFILFGFRVAFSSALINAVFLGLIFPGPSQPYYALSTVATVGMMLGIMSAKKLVVHNSSDWPLTKFKFIILSIFLGTLLRILLMGSTLFGILYFDPLNVYPSMDAIYIVVAVLPFDAVFNMIVSSYTIPSAYIITRFINRNLKLGKIEVRKNFSIDLY